MSPFKTSPFQNLEGKADPAWLWDHARGRIVWANRAGIAFWGEATLFDLLDHRFDPDGATVRKIREIAGTVEQNDAESDEVIFFPEAGQLVKCTCRITALEGERKGLLVAARRAGGKGQEAGGELFAQVVNSSPFAIGVFDRAGRLIYANAALGEVFANTEPETDAALGSSFHLARWMGSEDDAHALISRILLVGSHSAAQMMQTKFGPRTHRLTARRMSLEEGESAILIYFHDIEDRRRYELELESRLANLETKFQNLPEENDGETARAGEESRKRIPDKTLDETGLAPFSAPKPSEADEAEGKADEAEAKLENQGRQEMAVPDMKEAGVEEAEKEGVGKKAEGDEPEPGEDALPEISLDTIERPSIPDISEPLAPLKSRDGDLGKTPGNDTAAAEPAPRTKAELFDNVTLSPTKRQEAKPDQGKTPRPDLKGRDREAFSAIAQALRANNPVALETLELSQKREEIVLVDREDAGKSEDTDTGAEKAPASPPPMTRGSDSKETRETGPTDETVTANASANTFKQEITLEESEARVSELQAILDSAADGIITLDAEGRICSLNTASESILDCKKEAVKGKTFISLLSPSSAREVESYLEAVTETGVVGVFRDGREIEAVRPDKSRIPLFLTLGRIKSDETLQYCAVIRDISQWKKAEADLREAKERAEEDSEKKSDFLARISHELRTPLNAIIGFSEVMSEEKFGPIANDRYKGYVSDIRTSSEHLLSLINDLLDLTKIESGNLELDFTSVELPEIVNQSVSLMQPLATRERIVIRTSLPENLPPIVADHRSMRQIMLNLLSNAVKFTKPGGQVIVSVLFNESGEVVLRVRDTGIGMSEDELKKAMEPYRQIKSVHETGQDGTGLGLPLTRALAEANRAEFKIESARETGTLVQITFPTTRVLAE